MNKLNFSDSIVSLNSTSFLFSETHSGFGTIYSDKISQPSHCIFTESISNIFDFIYCYYSSCVSVFETKEKTFYLVVQCLMDYIFV